MCHRERSATIEAGEIAITGVNACLGTGLLLDPLAPGFVDEELPDDLALEDFGVGRGVPAEKFTPGELVDLPAVERFAVLEFDGVDAVPKGCVEDEETRNGDELAGRLDRDQQRVALVGERDLAGRYVGQDQGVDIIIVGGDELGRKIRNLVAADPRQFDVIGLMSVRMKVSCSVGEFEESVTTS